MIVQHFDKTPDARRLVDAALNRYAAILAPGVTALDSFPFFNNMPPNVGLATEDGAAIGLFGARPDDVYDGHLLCDPPYRGKLAVEFCKAICAHMFTRYAAAAITATIFVGNRSARRVFRAAGGIPEADTVDPLGRPCKIYRLGRQRWEVLSAGLPKV